MSIKLSRAVISSIIGLSIAVPFIARSAEYFIPLPSPGNGTQLNPVVSTYGIRAVGTSTFPNLRDASGNRYVTSTGTSSPGGLSGSGNAYQIAYFNGTSSVTSSQVFYVNHGATGSVPKVVIFGTPGDTGLDLATYDQYLRARSIQNPTGPIYLFATENSTSGEDLYYFGSEAKIATSGRVYFQRYTSAQLGRGILMTSSTDDGAIDIAADGVDYYSPTSLTDLSQIPGNSPGYITLISLSADGIATYNSSTGVFTVSNAGNWAGTWQSVNSSTFYLASNPSGFVSSSITIGTTTASGIFNVTSSGNKAFTITLPSNVGFFTNDKNYVSSTRVNNFLGTVFDLRGGSSITSTVTNGSTTFNLALNNNAAQTCGGTDKVSAISATGTVTCTADTGGSGSGTVTTSTAVSTGYVPFWGALPAALTGTSTIYSNSGNIGIYTTTSSYPLSIFAPVNATTVINMVGRVNGFFQGNIKNLSASSSASTDWVATADNGDDSTHYINMGINGSGGGAAPFTGANNAYLYSVGDTLHIGALGTSSEMYFYTTGGTASPKDRLRISSSGVVMVSSSLSLPYAPTSSILFTDSAGLTKGTSTFCWDNTNGRLGFRQSCPAPTFPIDFVDVVDGAVTMNFDNNSTGTSAVSSMRFGNDVGVLTFFAHGSGRATSTARWGFPVAGTGEIYMSGASAGGLSIGAASAKPIIIGNSDIARIIVAGDGSGTTFGSAIIATTTASATVSIAGTQYVNATSTFNQPINLFKGFITSSLGGASLASSTCTSTNVTVTGAVTSTDVVDATPVTYPGDTVQWKGYVSAANTVTVKVCNYTGIARTPTASTYNVIVRRRN